MIVRLHEEIQGADGPSQIDDNMQRAQQRNAAVVNAFHFRRNIFPLDRPRERYDLASRPVSPPLSASGSTSPTISRTNHFSPLSQATSSRQVNGLGNGSTSRSNIPAGLAGDSRPGSMDQSRRSSLVNGHTLSSGPSRQGRQKANGSSFDTINRNQSFNSHFSSDEEDVGEEDDTTQMTLDEVINGKGDHFPGLMGMVNAYLNSLNVDVGTKCELRRVLGLDQVESKR